MTLATSPRAGVRNQDVSSLILEASPGAARAARAFVRDHVVLDCIRQTEADLLVTELISNALGHGGPLTQLEVAVDTSHPRGVKISVAHDAAKPLVYDEKGSGFTLIERIAQGWGSDFDGSTLVVWFVLRRPGVAGAKSHLTDEELTLEMEHEPQVAAEALLKRHSDLAFAIARRYRGRGIGEEDLRQAAMMGLLKAIQRYQPELGDLRPYAAATISGELKRLLRDDAWSVRVPRAIQERVLNLSKSFEELTQRLNRQPTTAEVAEALDLRPEEVEEALFARLFYASRSIFKESTGTGLTIAEHLTCDPDEVDHEDRLTLEDVIASLPEKQAQIVRLRFYEDKIQDEIAEIVGISQMHVSRLLADALSTMRARLGAVGPEPS